MFDKLHKISAKVLQWWLAGAICGISNRHVTGDHFWLWMRVVAVWAIIRNQLATWSHPQHVKYDMSQLLHLWVLLPAALHVAWHAQDAWWPACADSPCTPSSMQASLSIFETKLRKERTRYMQVCIKLHTGTAAQTACKQSMHAKVCLPKQATLDTIRPWQFTQNGVLA